MKHSLFTELPLQRNPWTEPDAAENDVVLSSRVRLARNLAGHAFPGHSRVEQQRRIFSQILETVERLESFHPEFAVEISELDKPGKQLLVERGLATRELCRKGRGSGVAADLRQNTCVIINEEDHLRLQAVAPGLDFQAVWHKAAAVETELGTRKPFAFHPELGYLTACPTNAGTGLRVSAMLHLPGLVLRDQMPQVLRAADKLRLTVRGLFGEGTDAIGNVFQVSNQATLGESEESILQRLEKICRQVVWAERNARQWLVTKASERLLDRIGRAYGILRFAHSLSAEEALSQLCWLRLAATIGITPGLTTVKVGELIMQTQPGHLQLAQEAELEKHQAERVRAEIIRNSLRLAESAGDKS
jgi:protein arginine kinase